MSRDIRTIGDIGNTYTGLSGKTKDDFGHGDALYITFLNVLNNPIIDSSIFEKVDVKKGEKQNQCKKGDLFFNTSSETPEEVGMCAYLADDVPDLYLNSFCFGFHIKDKDIDGRYLSYYFRGKQGRKLMTMLAQGATRYNLSKENFMASEIELPMSNEQKRIATALYDIDTLIRNLDRTIEKKKNIRQGAMEQLLSGKKRLPGFKGEWKPVRLNEIFFFGKGKGLKKEELTENGKYKCILYGEIFTQYNCTIKSVVSKTDKYEGTLSKRGDILMPGSTTTTGIDLIKAVSLNEDNVLLGGDVIILRPKDKRFLCSDFMAYLMSVINRKNIADVTQGTTIIHLHTSNMTDILYTIPPTIKEQYAISDMLIAMDDEIAVLQMERDKYANIRSGMMDDLLSGAKRI